MPDDSRTEILSMAWGNLSARSRSPECKPHSSFLKRAYLLSGWNQAGPNDGGKVGQQGAHDISLTAGTAHRGLRNIVTLAYNSQFLHATAKGIWVHLEKYRCSTGAINHSPRSLEDLEDMAFFHLLERGNAG